VGSDRGSSPVAHRHHKLRKFRSMITIAIRQIDGEVVHISGVDRGFDCGCVCADYGERPKARKGPQKVHHFAHHARTDCRGETNLHKMGKQIVIDELRLTINHPDLDSPVTQMFETAREEVARGSEAPCRRTAQEICTRAKVVRQVLKRA